jgi:hypothetical protein
VRGNLWLFYNLVGTIVNVHRWGVQVGAFSTIRVSNGSAKGMLELCIHTGPHNYLPWPFYYVGVSIAVKDDGCQQEHAILHKARGAVAEVPSAPQPSKPWCLKPWNNLATQR